MRTSGSTGDPKPITLRREQMIASAQATGAALDLRPGCRALVCLPTSYIAGRMMLVRGLVLDMEMTVVEPTSNPFASLPSDAGSTSWPWFLCSCRRCWMALPAISIG